MLNRTLLSMDFCYWSRLRMGVIDRRAKRIQKPPQQLLEGSPILKSSYVLHDRKQMKKQWSGTDTIEFHILPQAPTGKGSHN